MTAPTANLDKTIESITAKIAQLQARRQKIEARKRTLNSKSDTRRKILVGAAVLAMVDRGEWSEAEMLARLDQYLTRPDDRALFGLPALDSAPAEPPLQPTDAYQSQPSSDYGADSYFSRTTE